MTQDIEKQPVSSPVPPRNRRRIAIAAGVLLLFLLIGGIMTATALQAQTAEAGEPFPPESDFVRWDFLPLVCESDISGEAVPPVGIHAVRFTLFGLPLSTSLTVADTTAPAFALRDLAVLGGDGVTPEDFLIDASDVSGFTYEMTCGGDYSLPGTHEMRFVFRDEYGNTAEDTVSLTVYGSTNSITMEAGSSEEDCCRAVLAEVPEAEFPESFAALDRRTPGERTAEIRIAGEMFRLRLIFADTTPPAAEIQNVYTLLGRTVQPQDFLRSVTDVTEVAAEFLREPDCTRPGQQKVQLRLTDAVGNTAEFEAQLTVSTIASAMTLEAGISQNDALEAILADERGASLARKVAFSTLSCGEHTVSVRTSGGNFDVALTVRDTTPPSAEGKRVAVYLPADHFPAAADFVENVTDASDVTAAFAGEVDFETPGKRAVTVRLTDAAGNSTDVTAVLAVFDDQTPPVISGVKNLSVYVNGRISYKSGVTAADGDGTSVAVSVDSSAVKLSVPGKYKITYSATDEAGNTATVSAVVAVLEITEDVVRPYAQNVLSRILRDSMTKREKARAIYDWMESNVSYVTYADKTYWLRAAYTGFTTGRGDCYVFYAMSRMLLDCAGIDNMEICRDNPAKPHYWNLVNCGDGWYHFDTCPHYKQYPLHAFMLTDAQVAEYSKNSVKDYYSFDSSLYPATPQQ